MAVGTRALESLGLMRVLVTGSEGYIGTILGAFLMGQGHEVTGLDTGFHRGGWLYHGVDRAPLWIAKDVRQVTVDDLRGYDAVVHLAELSNDPVGQLDPAITFEINHGGSVRLASLARDAGVERFLYMSSCSVYGAAGERDSTETSEVDPLTPYAMSKVLVERDVLPMADDGFSPTSLRNATAFGASPADALRPRRQRPRRPRMDGAGHPGRQRRTTVASVHPRPRHLPGGRRWSFGLRASSSTARCSTSAATSRTTRCGRSPRSSPTRSPAVAREFGEKPDDRRNYRANFDKIREVLGFEPIHDVVSGAQELLAVFRRIDLSLELFESRAYTRIKQIQHLLATGQIDDRLLLGRSAGDRPTRGRARRRGPVTDMRLTPAGVHGSFLVELDTYRRSAGLLHSHLGCRMDLGAGRRRSDGPDEPVDERAAWDDARPALAGVSA